MRVELLLTPSISGLSPAGAVAGGGGFTLAVNGANFADGAAVKFNGESRATIFVSSIKLTAQITVADIAASGTFPVTVVNPSGRVSSAVNFAVSDAPALRIDAIAPRAGRVSGGQQIKLTGAFANLSAVTIGGVAATWSYTSGTSEITVTTPARPVGAAAITLAPASGTSYTKSNGFAYLPTTFTDNTLVAGITSAKGQHIIELRQAVNALRAVAGLGAAPWNDPTLTPGSTVIRAVHITDLRAYLNEAAARLGYASTAFTDPVLGAGTPIKRVHVEELRQRIRAIAG